MERKIHDLVQGSPEWDLFRLDHDGASEAAAMLGLTKKTTRTELLRMKHTGNPKVFSEWVRENVLDRGHQVEAMARPLVEQMIGEDLYPATYSYGRMSASCDGLTMDGSTAFEHKQYNAELFAAIKRAELPDEHQPQCQQVMHVTGATRLIFVCSDGTLDNMASMEVLPDPEWIKRIVAGWAQFNEDLANYQHVETAPSAVAAPINELPALQVEITGAVTASNLATWKEIVTERIAGINTELTTDQHFADADSMVKFLDAGEKRIDLVKAQAQAQASDIDMVFRALDEIKASMRAKRLELSKLVDARKESIRGEIAAEATRKINEHIAALNKRIGMQLPPVGANFAVAMKNKRTVASLRDAVDAELARAKIAANEIADKIDANLKTLALHPDYAFLFNDRAALVLKDADDLALVIKSRIQDHKATEEKRQAEERERIRAEEERKAREKAAAEKAEEDKAREAKNQEWRSAEPAAPAVTFHDVATATAREVFKPAATVSVGVDLAAPGADMAVIAPHTGITGAARVLDEIDDILRSLTLADLIQVRDFAAALRGKAAA